MAIATRKTQDTISRSMGLKPIDPWTHRLIDSLKSLESNKTLSARKPNRRKYKPLGFAESEDWILRASVTRRKFSNIRMLAMMILLAVITLASISAFEWARDGFFRRSTIFTLKGVSIQGNHRISSADILDASNLRVGTDSIYSIMPHIVEKRIKSRLRYLEQVEVQRGFLRSEGMYGWVTIMVKEREPVAFVGSGKDAGSFAIIDANGFVMEEGIRERETLNVKRETLGDMPVIVGVDAGTLKSGAQNRPPALDLALNVLTNARSVIPELLDKISYIDAREPDNIILTLDTGYSILASSIQHPVSNKVTVRIASDRIKEGLGNILPVIGKRGDRGTLLSRNSHVFLDARFPGAVYCKVDEL